MSTASRLAQWMEGSEWLGQVAEPVNRQVKRLFEPGRFTDLTAGRWLGHPVHPMLVDLPIGCWTSAMALDVLGWPAAAQSLIGMGTIAVLPTAVTGLADWSDTSGAEQRVGFVHLTLNLGAAGLYALSWWARRSGRRATGVKAAFAGAALATTAGWLGGHLAFGLGVGVDTNAFEGSELEWTAIEDGSKGAALSQSEADGIAVAVARDQGRTYVLADRCSHRGGPLSQGAIGDDCVTCPWHGSQFELVTGGVRRGPAVVPQPVYEVRDGSHGTEVRRQEPRALRTNSVRIH